MHSLNHPALARSVEAERVQAAKGRARAARLQHPPPVRSRVAYVVARVASRLDSATARKAVA
jgi:hypothetical protein